ncbi:uncharacterized protein LOC125945613 [Dermacentor silvarum]|uniref:uncharacterized protein LOC125945613 n=1 Tax=Dermacentor silvarum TaxID=543639 RepID=UPI0021013FFE|nr:uncharacterized protein LOC125945613 [Dermacentor silvarum]
MLTCLENVRGADAEYYVNQLHHYRKELRSCVKVQLDRASAANQPCSAQSFVYCLTQALHDKVSKKKKAGVKPFARKIKHCMRQKLKPVHARAFFVPMTTVLAGQAGTEDHTEMPFEVPLMMTTSGRTSL